MSDLVAIAIIVPVVLVLALVWLHIERSLARDLIEDHQRTWPDRCPVCDYHRFALREGFVRAGSKLAPHCCPEAEREGTK